MQILLLDLPLITDPKIQSTNLRHNLTKMKRKTHLTLAHRKGSRGNKVVEIRTGKDVIAQFEGLQPIHVQIFIFVSNTIFCHWAGCEHLDHLTQ